MKIAGVLFLNICECCLEHFSRKLVFVLELIMCLWWKFRNLMAHDVCGDKMRATCVGGMEGR